MGQGRDRDSGTGRDGELDNVCLSVSPSSKPPKQIIIDPFIFPLPSPLPTPPPTQSHTPSDMTCHHITITHNITTQHEHTKLTHNIYSQYHHRPHNSALERLLSFSACCSSLILLLLNLRVHFPNLIGMMPLFRAASYTPGHYYLLLETISITFQS